MHSLSIRTKLVVLFSALVAVPLVAAVAWLGVTAHRSVLEAGRALTRVADDSLQQSATDVARLTGENAGRSSDELVRMGRQSLTGFARREVSASEQAVRHSATSLTQTGSAIMQGATERIASASSAAVNDANARLRRHQRQAIGEVSQALIGSSRRAFDRVGRDLTAQSEELVLGLARDLNLERSRRTAELVLTFLQNQMDALDQAAQEPRLLSDNTAVVARLLRQLREKHPAALLRTELLEADGTVLAQWPPPLTTPPEPSAPASVIAAALRADHTVPSAPQFGPPGTPPTMEIAAAVRAGGPGAAARGRRVLAATLSLAMLSDLLAQQAPGQGPQAPILVMTREGQVLAHSQPANVGIPFSLRRPARMQRVDPYTVMYESASSGPRRLLTHLTEIRGTDGWVVVAIQPLTELLAKTDGLRRAIQTTAESAADEMAREANAHAARLEAAAVQDQRLVAAETARQVRRENQAVIRQAVGALVRQQGDSAHGDIERVKSDSRAASEAAARAMTRTARGIAAQSAEKIRSEAVRRAHLGLESMHELASMTAAASAGRIVFEAAGVLLVALIGALLVALLTARSAVRPITALASGARSIAQGDFSHRVPISSEDELGQLAASFNRMAASIEASRAELQASNAILAQEKRRIQAIVDNSPDGLLILNEDGSVGYANPAARSLLPWRGPGGGNGATPLEAVLPPALLQALEECLQAIDRGGADVCDLALEAPQRVLQVRSVLLESAGARGGGVGRLIHLHDVTREREIDELKSNFVMLVSHELRTPLTSILGFSSYMLMGKMGPLTEAQRGGLDSIARQAHRLKAIAADFLDLSRIETGQLELRREPVDLERVARRVLEELDPQAHERGLWLRLAPVNGPAMALGDESRITQIFTNLIHNGIKFTEHGGVEVAIAPGGEMVRVEVRDTGIGIPLEEQARVFDRFYQVEGVVTRRAGGTGLGLSIVKILVQAHGGEVGVCSFACGGADGQPAAAEPRGTTFYFTLPAAKPSLVSHR